MFYVNFCLDRTEWNLWAFGSWLMRCIRCLYVPWEYKYNHDKWVLSWVLTAGTQCDKHSYSESLCQNSKINRVMLHRIDCRLLKNLAHYYALQRIFWNVLSPKNMWQYQAASIYFVCAFLSSILSFASCVCACSYFVCLVINFHKFIYTNEPFRPSACSYIHATHTHTWHILRCEIEKRISDNDYEVTVTYLLSHSIPFTRTHTKIHSLCCNFYSKFVYSKSIFCIDPI